MIASAARNTSTRWKIPDANELNDWTNRFVDQLKQLPELEDVATDQQTGGLAVSLVIDRVTASRLGIAPTTIDNTLYDAFGQRQINTMYTQVNQYHVILESEPQFQLDPNKLNHLYIQANASSGATGTGASSSFSASGSSAAGSNALTATALYTPSANTLAPPANALTSDQTIAAASKGANSAGTTTSTMSNAVPLERVLSLRNHHGAALDHPPGTISRRYGLVQPAPRMPRWVPPSPTWTRCKEQMHMPDEPAGGFSRHGGIVPELALERAAV